MPQSSVIAGALAAALLFWLAANNRLTAYASILWGPTVQPTPSGNLFVPPASSGGTEGPVESPSGTSGGGGAANDNPVESLGSDADAASTALDFLEAF